MIWCFMTIKLQNTPFLGRCPSGKNYILLGTRKRDSTGVGKNSYSLKYSRNHLDKETIVNERDKASVFMWDRQSGEV